MTNEHSTERDSDSARPANGGGSSTWFPLSQKEGWSQWCTNLSPAATEEKVLSFIPDVHPARSPSSVPGSAGPTDDSDPVCSRTSSFQQGFRRWHSCLVQLQGKTRALNEFSIERAGEQVRHNLVMLHGYGAGLAFFYKNFDSLSCRPGWRLYALDMLGMGRSSRPPFKIAATDGPGKIAEAENWFIDALEEWRVHRGIQRLTLLGHSMGGYVATAYALKYPGHVEKLILVSPVGIPEDPFATTSDGALDRPPVDSLDTPAIPLDMGAADVGPHEHQRQEGLPFQKQPSKWLVRLWDANISPFSFIRLSGPLGPRLTSAWTSRRFAHLPRDEALALHDYSYSLFRQRGSGEYALSYLLTPRVFARSPLVRRIHRLGRQEGENGVPVVFMYGDNDWMDVQGGHAAKRNIDAESKRVLEHKTEAERKTDNGRAKVVVVKQAGHHLYLDNFDEFNRVIQEELHDVERKTS